MLTDLGKDLILAVSDDEESPAEGLAEALEAAAMPITEWSVAEFEAAPYSTAALLHRLAQALVDEMNGGKSVQMDVEIDESGNPEKTARAIYREVDAQL